ncbi:caspase family protein [Paracoccus actinidiae]|uniref:caspase family protein n=1 Tax=Paracoccus actinidiae TaxID=3064531 RepID=UPI0027D24132|nr:caspase family protein [Paracoccus sp. M09]
MAFLVLIAAASSAHAQEFTDRQSIPESRFALLIGNEAYPTPWKLYTPISDVEAIGGRLRDFGFSTTILTDASFPEILLAVDRYRRALKAADGRPIGFFYFAGHGFMNEREEENFLVPVNGTANMSAIMDESVSLSLMLSLLAHDNGNAAQIIMIDACRAAIGISSDTRDFVPVGGGFSQVSPPGGIAMMLSTRPRQLAYDRTAVSTQYSPFAQALLETLEKPGLGTLALMSEVMVRTAELTATQTPNQIPAVYASSGTDILINPASATGSQADLPAVKISVVHTELDAPRGAAHELITNLDAQGLTDMRSRVQPLLNDLTFVARANDLLSSGLTRDELDVLIDQYKSVLPRPANGEPPFYYYATGALLPGSGIGSLDPVNYAPDIIFPVLSNQVASVSQVYRPGGPGEIDIASTADFRGPVPIWRDNFCEERRWSVPTCPAGRGHQGVDLVIWTNDGPTFARLDTPVVAVEAGTIIQKTDNTTLVLRGDSGRVWRYLSLNIRDEIKRGYRVDAGDLLGTMSDILGGRPGGTTVHLHLDLRIDNTFRNPYPALLAAYERRVGPGRKIAEGERFLLMSLCDVEPSLC